MLVRALVLISMLFLSSLVFADEVKTQESEQAQSDIKSEKKSPAKDVTSMEEIVVTATRTEKEVSEAPASVSVVTKEEIKKRDIRSVDEALNTLPGVYNLRYIQGGLMDTLAQVTLRGMPRANKTLILIDGITINDPYSASQRAMLAIEPENIERIEIVKGPFSSLYGGYAMGGVVNIMTRMPEKREFTLKTGYGSSWNRGESLDDLKRFYISYGDKLWNKLSLFLNYGYQGTNGYSTDESFTTKTPHGNIVGWSYTTDPQGKSRFRIGDPGDRTSWDDKINAKLGYDFSENSKIVFNYTRFRFKYDFDEPHTYLKDTNTGAPVVWPNEQAYLTYASGPLYSLDNIYNLSYETEIGIVKSKLTLGFIDGHYWYTYPTPGSATFSGGGGTVTETPKEMYNADLQFTLPLGKRQILTFGGSFLGGSAESRRHSLTDWRDEDSKTTLEFESKGKYRMFSFYMQDEIMLLSNLTVYPSLRYDWWEAYDGYVNVVGKAGYPKNFDSTDKSNFSPKFAVVYKPFEKTALRASVGTAFRPPTIYELYSASITSQSVTEGNPDLKPEKSLSWDAGVQQTLWKGAKIDLTYFENYLKDLVYMRTIGDAPAPYEGRTLNRQENVGKAESRGVEMGITQQFDNWLKLFANYTYTDTEITDNPAKPEIVGKKLVMVPEKMFNIGGDCSYGPFSASLTGRYVSKRYYRDDNADTKNDVWGTHDPYFVADAKVSYKVTKFSTLSFSVNNLFDEDYYVYYKAPGRSWFSELTIRF